MYKDTRTFEDYDGKKVTKTFYFNLNKAEIAEMELTTDGGLGDRLDRIIKAQDTPSIIKEFKSLILKSYGEKSEDGLHFNKSEEISKAFESTQAYSDLFMELIESPEKASAFINGIVPQEATAKIQEIPKQHTNPVPMP